MNRILISVAVILMTLLSSCLQVRLPVPQAMIDKLYLLHTKVRGNRRGKKLDVIYKQSSRHMCTATARAAET